MKEKLAISSPELFHIKKQPHGFYYGANQIWYPQQWQRQAGCGPTSCSHLMWYLSKTKESCRELAPYDGSSREGFLALMKSVWEYVTPGMKGVNNTEIFKNGALQYGREKGVMLRARILNIPAKPFKRPEEGRMAEYMACILEKDLPVSFLNLSNGRLANLDNWHWVTLVSYAPGRGTAVMYDQGEKSEIDLRLWLKTTTLGGGFIALEPAV